MIYFERHRGCYQFPVSSSQIDEMNDTHIVRCNIICISEQSSRRGLGILPGESFPEENIALNYDKSY